MPGIPTFRSFKVINERLCDLQEPTGCVRYAALADIQLFMPAEYIVSMSSDETAF